MVVKTFTGTWAGLVHPAGMQPDLLCGSCDPPWAASVVVAVDVCLLTYTSWLLQAWVDVALDSSGIVQLRAASDSKLTAGLAGVLVAALSGLTPEQLLEVDGAAFLQMLNLGAGVVAPSRAAGAANLLAAIQRRTRVLTTQLPRFPSLLITRDSLQPQGAFAEAQAQFLQPNAQQVAQLVELLRSKRIGVVAHFYMDPQVRSLGAWRAWPAELPASHNLEDIHMCDAALSMLGC
jgi:quinolinate synthase